MCLPKDGEFYGNLGRHIGLPLRTSGSIERLKFKILDFAQ
jgi:hypothetical protein